MPTNGNGLNPLLQNPSMLIHPICLYLGFTGFVIPFAYCMAALLSGDLSGQWIQLARRWTLVAWGFLTVGIILGGHWAYIELGWGGFWAWDPVENASFLPWLTATAFLHSVIVQERRNMLRIWNVSLCALTYILTVFGTFLTRSGIVQSVHAFAEGNVGQWLLTYIVFITLLTIVTIAYRYRELRSPESLESYFSREAAFLFNNLVLLGICFATFWGVMFPVFSEALGYEKSVVGPPFFNQVNGPLFLVLIALMGYGPLISWKRNSWQNFAKLVWRPLLAGSAVTVLFLGIDGTRIIAAVSFGLFVFVLGTIMGEFHRAARIRRELSQGEGALQSLVSVVRRKPERYGGYIVHLGVVFMAVGITASTIYKIEKDFVLKLGQPAELGGYSLELMSLQEEQFKNYAALRAVVQVRDAASRQILGELHPEQRFYPASQQTTTEVDTRATPWQDLYIALGGIDPELKETGAAFKVFINPLQFWVWVGGMIMLGGTLVLVVSAFRMRQVVRESVVTSSVVRA